VPQVRFLERPLDAQIPDELVGSVVELVELVPLLKIHATASEALDAPHSLAQLTENSIVCNVKVKVKNVIEFLSSLNAI